MKPRPTTPALVTESKPAHRVFWLWKGRYVVRWSLLALLILVVCLLFRVERFFSADNADDGPIVDVPVQPGGAERPVRLRQEALAALAVAPVQAFPGSLPWLALNKLAVHREHAIEQLIRNDPTAFLQMCLDRYDSEVHGYTCILQKKERVKGTLRPMEIVEAHFREHPFSVFMEWKKGAEKARRVLYVEGENNDQMLARPAGLIGFLVVSRAVDAPDVKASGRYLITQFGIKLGTVRTLAAMLKAKARDALHVKYEGVFRVPELGDRPCYKLVRTPYTPVEDEGVNELTIYVDTETWLHTGSILKDSTGKLIAEYFFRNIHLNPTFTSNQFTRSAL